MNKDTRSRIIALVVAVLIITVAVVAAIVGDIGSKGELSYTDEELQVLYQNYGITNNDIKFAKGELPNFLDGTILNSGKMVLVTEDGTPPENMEEGKDYDVILSEQEMEHIIENARMDYIEAYGVDPSDPKIDSVNGYLLPKEEVDRLMLFHINAETMESANIENQEEAACPWFEGDELGRLSTDELRELAETNETVRELIEEDLKIDGAKVESLEDLEHLPEGYPEELKEKYLEELGYAAGNQSQVNVEFNNSSDPFL
ncbi:hypothetical protein V7O62_07320 [Methanolobus sp. ZRKC2]|uniref:hypothetical protein n=1 Tax=Methanolobus sp. ZRKC2 TaxID=3125783 RepID=UPI0032491D6E